MVKTFGQTFSYSDTTLILLAPGNASTLMVCCFGNVSGFGGGFRGRVGYTTPFRTVRCKGLVKKYGGGGARAFGNVVDKKHMTHPLSSAQDWLTHP